MYCTPSYGICPSVNFIIKLHAYSYLLHFYTRPYCAVRGTGSTICSRFIRQSVRQLHRDCIRQSVRQRLPGKTPRQKAVRKSRHDRALKGRWDFRPFVEPTIDNFSDADERRKNRTEKPSLRKQPQESTIKSSSNSPTHSCDVKNRYYMSNVFLYG